VPPQVQRDRTAHGGGRQHDGGTYEGVDQQAMTGRMRPPLAMLVIIIIMAVTLAIADRHRVSNEVMYGRAQGP
jgi:hypothetical protein